MINTNNKWVRFELVNVNIFIIRVEFELVKIDTIRILTRHEHNSLRQLVTPNYDVLGLRRPYQMKRGAKIGHVGKTHSF